LLDRFSALINDLWIFHIQENSEPIYTAAMGSDVAVSQVETKEVDVGRSQLIEPVLGLLAD